MSAPPFPPTDPRAAEPSSAASSAHSGDAGGGSTASQAADAASSTASSAKDHAQQLAGNATEAAGDVAHQATEKARDLVGEVRSRVTDEAGGRRDQAVSALRSLGDELDTMRDHDGERGLATDLAGRSGGYARRAADWLDGREPSDLLGDVQRFARERPGSFLLGALVAGIIAGRATRALRAGAPSGGGGGHRAVTDTTAGPSVAVPPPITPPASAATPAPEDGPWATTDDQLGLGENGPRDMRPEGVVDDLSALPNRPGNPL